jgi:hypothetical protein
MPGNESSVIDGNALASSGGMSPTYWRHKARKPYAPARSVPASAPKITAVLSRSNGRLS